MIRSERIALLYTLALVQATLSAQTPTVLWTRQADAAGASIHPTRTATDSQGNVYVAGHFGDEYHVDGTVLQAVTPPTTDVFLSKFDASGAHLWSRSFGAEGTDNIYGLCVDPQDHVLICGRTSSDSVAFDGITIHKGASNFAGFWARFDPAGLCVVAKATACSAPFPALSNTSINAIASDPQGNIYITGGWRADTLRFDGLALVNQRPIGQVVGTNVFVARFSSSGSCDWLTGNGQGTVPGNSNAGSAIAVDGNGALFISGTFGGTRMVLGQRTLGVFDLDEGFYARLDGTDGSVDWVRAVRGANLGSNTYDAVNAIVPDDAGHLYIGGNYVGHQVDIDSLMVLPSPLNVNANKGFLFTVAAADGLPVWGRVLGESATGSASLSELHRSPGRQELALVLSYQGGVAFGGVSPPVAAVTNGLLLLCDTAGAATGGLALSGSNVELFSGAAYDAQGALVACGKYDGGSAQLGTQATVSMQLPPDGSFSMLLCMMGTPTSGVTAIEAESLAQVFPNPCVDELCMSLPQSTMPVHYEVLGVDGRCIIHGIASPMRGLLRIDLRALPAGHYVLRLEGDGARRAERFVKQ
jgi:hypothetical protein